MLQSLAIRDVVLIERLDLGFSANLTVLTGETGAGKSILLDALGLAIGFRADSGLVRKDAAQASVTAAFSVPPDHPARAVLADQGIEIDDLLLLRRIVTADGRSRAFVNDQASTVGLLAQLGQTLVEIQGQSEQHGLLDTATHRELLDAFAGTDPRFAALAAGWKDWKAADRELDTAEALLAKSRAEEEWLRHGLAELDAAQPRAEEESELTERRALLLHHTQVMEAVTSAAGELAGDRGALRGLNAAARLLERIRDKAGGRLEGAIGALERALIEAEEASEQIDGFARGVDGGAGRLEEVEERLFLLRGLARKHSVAVNALADLQASFADRLGLIEDGTQRIDRLRKEAGAQRQGFDAACRAVSALRADAAQRLDALVNEELPPLKLERARFATLLTALPPAEWGEDGAEHISFQVATNPGSAPGQLAKIASGGEMSRFLLALKLVLANVSPVPTLVFDEVDTGIGGATAASVGERLRRLGSKLQILVVTHSPQVAANGDHHWRVAKHQDLLHTETRVELLEGTERQEEIARMLAGSEITAAARAAADSLLRASPRS